MAKWISDGGHVIEIRMSRAGHLIEKEDVRNWVGAAFAIFYLNAELLLLADLSAKARGAARNVKATRLLRRSTLEPLTEIFGDVLVARRDEVSLDNLLRTD